ncbi:MAG: 5-formyltetrahydrofolate cyclo-ligase [Geminicoccaceae bacterium]
MPEEKAVQGWDEVKGWRREQRARLIERRQAISQNERRRLQPLITRRLEEHFPQLARALVGFYWPFRGEVGLHALVRRLVGQGGRAALPVVVEKRQPLEFWAWSPGAPLARGVWKIPIPAAREVVQPTVFLVPLVGFDDQGYRLGYGGGYYDRTLAAMSPRPLAIGVGYEFGRLGTIHPQPHDIPLDAIVTEAGVMRPRSERRSHGARPHRGPDAFADVDEDPNGLATYASPPCFMHELDPSYLGLAPHPDVEPAGSAPKDADAK